MRLYFVSFVLCLIIILSSGYGFLDVPTSMRRPSNAPAVSSQGLAVLRSTLAALLIPLLSFGLFSLRSLCLDAEQLTLLILSAAPVFSV